MSKRVSTPPAKNAATAGDKSKASRYSKSRGFNVEKQAEAALQPVFPGIRRVGSPAYKKAAADLVQDGEGTPLPLVVTRDKGQPLLVTLSVEDFRYLVTEQRHFVENCPVAVQVKARASSWIGRVWRELVQGLKR